MIYVIAPKPTLYAGTQFRSRLEATWAAFFDLIDISWDYEPYDLKGWTPDFALHCNGHEILAEVKPVYPADNHKEEYSKASAHSRNAWILLLGSKPDVLTTGLLYDHPRLTFHAEDPWWEVHEIIAPFVDIQKTWREASNKTRWRHH